MIMQMQKLFTDSPSRHNYESVRPVSNTNRSLDRYLTGSGVLSPRNNHAIGALSNNRNAHLNNEDLGSSNYKPHKSYGKESLQDRNFLIKSRISQFVGMENGGLEKESEKSLYSPKLLFLLSHEEENLNYFK